MLKSITVSLFFTVLFLYEAKAQLRLIYNETFVSNVNNWPVSADNNSSIGLSEGNYKMEILENDYSRWVYAYPVINPRTYFIIEVKMKMQKVDDNFKVGVIWNVNQTNKNLFTWTNNGKVHGESKVDDVVTDLGTEDSGIKFTNDETHVLKVKSFSNRCEFYIDDKLVKKTDKLPYKLDNGVGVYLYDKGVMMVDYIKVYQERDPINLAETNFKGTKKENLGNAVNTVYSEVQPMISHDGNTLYFTRKDCPGNTNGPRDDIYVSTKDESGNFTKATNLGKPVNNSDYNSVSGISADGNTLLVSGLYNENGANIGDGFCEFTKSSGSWSKPKNLKVKNYYNDNIYSESNYGPNGDVLVLAIERKDTKGGKDIYIALKQADGTFGAPFNAGSVVNSFDDEISPFLAGDNKTLYFASEGLSGYGASDVFMTRRLDDTWTNWSKPINMGPEINSKEWEAYFTIDAKGEWAYMVSTNHSVGKSDIFRFKIPNELKPDTVESMKILKQEFIVKKDTVITTTIKKDTSYTITKTTVDSVIKKEETITHQKFDGKIYGKVYDAKSGKPLNALVEIKELELDKVVKSVMSDENGYEVVVEEGYHYDFYANYMGFIPEHVSLDLTTVNGSINKQIDIYLKHIEKDQTINMNSIFFEEGKTDLRYDSRGELVHVANLMKENPKMTILIGGHTSFNHESSSFNRKISEARAKEVFKALVKLGVDRKRMKVKGYGHDKPMYDVNSLWENAKNRRVDFTILTM